MSLFKRAVSCLFAGFLFFAGAGPVSAAVRTQKTFAPPSGAISKVHQASTSAYITWTSTTTSFYYTISPMDLLNSGSSGILTINKNLLMEFRNSAGTLLWSYQIVAPEGYELSLGDSSSYFGRLNFKQTTGSVIRTFRDLDNDGTTGFILPFSKAGPATPYGTQYDIVVRKYKISAAHAVSVAWDRSFATYSQDSSGIAYAKNMYVENTAGDGKYEIHCSTMGHNGDGSSVNTLTIFNANGDIIGNLDGMSTVNEGLPLKSHIDTSKTYSEIMMTVSTDVGNGALFYQWDGSAYAPKWILPLYAQSEQYNWGRMADAFPRGQLSDLDGDGNVDFIVALSSYSESGDRYGIIKFYSNVASYTSITQEPTVVSPQIPYIGDIPAEGETWFDPHIRVAKGRAGGPWQLAFFTQQVSGEDYRKRLNAVDIGANMFLDASNFESMDIWRRTITDKTIISSDKQFMFDTDVDGDGYIDVIYNNYEKVLDGGTGFDKFNFLFVPPNNDSAYSRLDLVDPLYLNSIPTAYGYTASDMDGDNKADLPVAWMKVASGLYDIGIQLYNPQTGSPKWEMTNLGGGLNMEPAFYDLSGTGRFDIVYSTHASDADATGALNDFRMPAYNAFVQISSPTGFAATVISTSMVRWSWTSADANVSTFTVFDMQTGAAVSPELGPSLREWIETGLSSTTPVVRYVSAYSASIGNGQWANSASTICYTAAPYNAELIPLAGLSGANKITWAYNAANRLNYSILTATSGVIAANLGMESRNFVETGLLPNTQYQRLLLAVNNLGFSTSTVVSTYTAAALPLMQPADVYFTSATVHYSSGNPTEGYNPAGTKYAVLYSTVSHSEGLVFAGTTTANSLALTGLTPNTIYYVVAAAANALGAHTESSTATFTTNTTDPVGPISSFTATSLSSTSIQWNWAAAENAQYYVVYDTASFVLATTTGTTFVKTGLSVNAPYGCYVMGYNTVSSTATGVTVGYTYPALPTNVTFSDISGSSFTVSWSTNTNPLGTYYQVDIAEDPYFMSVIAQSYTGSTSLYETGFSSGTAYYLRLFAWDSSSMTRQSVGYTTASVTTLDNPIGPIAAPEVRDFTSSSITWGWSFIENARYIGVYTEEGVLIATVTQGHGEFYEETGLTPNTRYTRYLRAFNNDYSVLSDTTTQLTKATVPMDLSIPAESVQRSSFTASWSANGNPSDTEYYLEVSTDSAFGSTATYSAGTELTLDVDGLEADTSYYVRAYALDRDGFMNEGGGYSGVVNILTASNPPGPISTYTVVTLSSSSILLNWGAAERVGEYRIYSSTGVLIGTLPASSTTVLADRLNPNTYYSAYIMAVNSQGFSSTTIQGATTYSAVPENLAASTIYQSSAVISWNANNNPVGTTYLVDYTTDPDFVSPLRVSTTGTSTLIYALDYETTYYARAFSVDYNGILSAQTDTMTFVTLDGPVGPASTLSGTALSSAAISWQWSAVSNARGYIVRTSTGGFLADIPEDGFTYSWDEENLSPNVRYLRYVQAYNNATSTGSVTVGKYTKAVTPEDVSLDIHSSSVTIAWTDSVNPPYTSYAVEYSTSSGFEAEISTISVPVTTNTITMAGLSYNTTYYGRLYAINGDDVWTPSSGHGSFTTKDGPITPIFGGVYGQSLGVSSITWSWNSKADARGFILKSTAGVTIATLGAGVTTYTETGLPYPDYRYIRYIEAYNDYDSTTSANGYMYTFAAIPSSVTIASAEVFRSSFTVRWNANGNPTGVTHYEAQLSVNNFASTTTVQTSTDVFSTFTDLLAETSYYVRIVPINSIGIRNAPSAIANTYTASNPPGPITSFWSVVDTDSSMYLYWNSVTRASEYLISDQYNVVRATLTASDTQWEATGLSPNTTYMWTLTAVNSQGISSATTTSEYTYTAVPLAPTVLGHYRSSATLTWGTNGNPAYTTYVVEYSTNGAFVPYSSSTATTNYALLEGLAANTTYYVRAAGINGNLVKGSASPATPFYTLDPAIGTAGSLSAFTSSTTLEWNWPPVNYARYYQVVTLEGVVLATVPSSSLDWTETGLTPNTGYYRYLRAINNSSQSEGTITSYYTEAAIPQNVVAYSSEVYRSSATVRWAANGNPAGTSYRVEYSTDSMFVPFTAMSTTTALSAMLTGLTAETSYYARLVAVNGRGFDSGYSDAISMLTASTPPGPISSFTATIVSSNSFVLNWTAAAKADLYRIYTSTDGLLATLSSGTLSWTQLGLTPNTAYSRYIVAENSQGISTAAVTSDYTFASVPVQLSTTVVYQSSASLIWSANNNPVGTEYDVEYSTSPSFASFGTVTASTTFTLLSGLASNATYYARVFGVNADDIRSGASSAMQFYTLDPTIGAAGSLSAFTSSTTLEWNWSPVANARYYQVVTTEGVVLATTASSSLDWTETGLTPNTVYYRYLRALNNSSQSEGTITSYYTEAAIPQNVVAYSSEVYRSSATIRWDVNNNPLGTLYTVAFSTDSGFGGYSTAVTAFNYAMLIGFQADTSYYLKVMATNERGFGTDYSSPISILTASNPPGPIETFAATVKSSTSVQLDWSAATKASEYRIYSSTGALLQTITAPAVTWTQNGLVPNKIYGWSITAINSQGFSSHSVITANTFAAIPSSFTVNEMEVYRTSATVRWAANNNPAGTIFEVKYGTDSTGTVYLTSDTANVYATLTGLTAGTSYYARAAAYNDDGYLSGHTGFVNFLTASNPPGPIASLVPTVLGTTSVRLDWSAADRASVYRIYTATGSLAQTVSSSTLLWVSTGLVPNSAYGWSVMAVNSQGYSSHSVVTANTFAAMPSSLTASGIYRSSFTLTWHAGGNPAGSAYDVQYSTESGFLASVTTTTQVAATTVLINGLNYNTTYYTRVFGVNADSIRSSATATLPVWTVDGPIPAFTGFAGTALSSTSIQWGWSTIANAVYVDIYTSTGGALATVAAGALSWTETGLNANAAYSRYAVARNSSDAKQSNTATRFTQAAVAGTPTMLTTARASAVIEWTSSNPASTTYYVQYSTDSGYSAGSSTQVVSASTYTYRLTGLTPGTGYYARVLSANNDGVVSAPSGSANFTTRARQTVSSLSVSSAVNTQNGVALAVGGTSLRYGDTVYITTGIGAGRIMHPATTTYNSGSSVDAQFSLIGLNPGVWNIVVMDADSVESATSSASEFTVLFGTTTGSPIAIASTTSSSQLEVQSPNNMFGLSVPNGITVLTGSLIYTSTCPEVAPIAASTAQIVLANGAPPAGYATVGNSVREVSAYQNSQYVTGTFETPVTLMIYYPDTNNDGIVDGTNIQAINLRIFWLNTATSVWDIVPGSVVDTANKRVTATVSHFSVYSLLGATVMSNLDAVKVYPNPWQPGSGGTHDRATMKFDKLAADTVIRIYNVAGEQVRELPSSNIGYVEWDGKNDNGKTVSSGVYFARFKSGDSDKILKIAVER